MRLNHLRSVGQVYVVQSWASRACKCRCAALLIHHLAKSLWGAVSLNVSYAVRAHQSLFSNLLPRMAIAGPEQHDDPRPLCKRSGLKEVRCFRQIPIGPTPSRIIGNHQTDSKVAWSFA
jgi:hypothetical protein